MAGGAANQVRRVHASARERLAQSIGVLVVASRSNQRGSEPERRARGQRRRDLPAVPDLSRRDGQLDVRARRTGQPVDLVIDTFPDRVFHGTVSAIAPATGATFSVLPSQNSSANWVKVVQRLPLRIAFDPSEDTSMIRAGMSVTVDIDTGHKRKLSDLF